MKRVVIVIVMILLLSIPASAKLTQETIEKLNDAGEKLNELIQKFKDAKLDKYNNLVVNIKDTEGKPKDCSVRVWYNDYQQEYAATSGGTFDNVFNHGQKFPTKIISYAVDDCPCWIVSSNAQGPTFPYINEELERIKEVIEEELKEQAVDAISEKGKEVAKEALSKVFQGMGIGAEFAGAVVGAVGVGAQLGAPIGEFITKKVDEILDAVKKQEETLEKETGAKSPLRENIYLKPGFLDSWWPGGSYHTPFTRFQVDVTVKCSEGFQPHIPGTGLQWKEPPKSQIGKPTGKPTGTKPTPPTVPPQTPPQPYPWAPQPQTPAQPQTPGLIPQQKCPQCDPILDEIKQKQNELEQTQKELGKTANDLATLNVQIQSAEQSVKNAQQKLNDFDNPQSWAESEGERIDSTDLEIERQANSEAYQKYSKGQWTAKQLTDYWKGASKADRDKLKQKTREKLERSIKEAQNKLDGLKKDKQAKEATANSLRAKIANLNNALQRLKEAYEDCLKKCKTIVAATAQYETVSAGQEALNQIAERVDETPKVTEGKPIETICEQKGLLSDRIDCKCKTDEYCREIGIPVEAKKPPVTCYQCGKKDPQMFCKLYGKKYFYETITECEKKCQTGDCINERLDKLVPKYIKEDIHPETLKKYCYACATSDEEEQAVTAGADKEQSKIGEPEGGSILEDLTACKAPFVRYSDCLKKCGENNCEPVPFELAGNKGCFKCRTEKECRVAPGVTGAFSEKECKQYCVKEAKCIEYPGEKGGVCWLCAPNEAWIFPPAIPPTSDAVDCSKWGGGWFAEKSSCENSCPKDKGFCRFQKSLAKAGGCWGCHEESTSLPFTWTCAFSRTHSFNLNQCKKICTTGYCEGAYLGDVLDESLLKNELKSNNLAEPTRQQIDSWKKEVRSPLYRCYKCSQKQILTTPSIGTMPQTPKTTLPRCEDIPITGGSTLVSSCSSCKTGNCKGPANINIKKAGEMIGTQRCYVCKPASSLAEAQTTAVSTEPPQTMPTQPTQPQPTDCTCAQGTSPEAPSTSSIHAQLQQYRCVTGVDINIQATRKTNCPPCYGAPQITVNSQPPVCQTGCGPVQCDSSTTCPCPDRPNCSLTVRCGWYGWKPVGENQFVPFMVTS